MDNEANNIDNTCYICYEQMYNSNRIDLLCNHAFCMNCVGKLIELSECNNIIKCPMCRKAHLIMSIIIYRKVRCSKRKNRRKQRSRVHRFQEVLLDYDYFNNLYQNNNYYEQLQEV